MTTLRQITDELTEQYNNAVDFYYKADFLNFFSNIRSAVENVYLMPCKTKTLPTKFLMERRDCLLMLGLANMR